MNLLIVDDQRSVIDGLRSGIDWFMLHIEKVFTALNTVEARAVLKEENIEIVLCDIEMPMESGMELLRWIKATKRSVYFIFLTSHSDFAYAQEAIKLGAADYVIQPASYEEIENVVKKAVKAVVQEQEQKNIIREGKVFNKQKKQIVSDAIRNLIKERWDRRSWETLSGMQLLPKLLERGYLVLMQIVHWNTASEIWETGLLEASLENVLSEMFVSHNQIACIASIDNTTYAMLFQGYNKEEMSQQNLAQQLEFLGSVCTQYFKCDIACYFSHPIFLEEAPGHWKKLMEERDSNVMMKKGNFYKDEIKSGTQHEYRIPQTKYWQSLLREGYPKAVETGAIELLDRMSEEGIMNHIILRNFYQDFMQMLYSTMEEDGKRLRDIFQTSEQIELYRNGMKSVGQMKELIHFIAEHYVGKEKTEDTKTLMQEILEYIADHLEEDLRRDDIADAVYLNRDYLSRMFHKEMGISLKEYITEQKMKAAKGLLHSTNLPISLIAAKMGYCNSSHFSANYKKVMGLTPQEERNETKKET